MDSVLEEYKASLADLTFNSKPLINMLTVLAEENYSYAADIVRIIEGQVYQSPPNQRLPVLYLIDSIVKTYGPYVKLFSANLIKTFLFVFEKAETRVRQDLFKLRSTWSNMFSRSLLHDLDVAVKQFDPNWPVRSKREKKSTHPSGLTLDERVAAMITQPSHSSPEGQSRFSSDEEEYKVSYHEEEDDGEGGLVVEEEEILVDEENDELQALEQVLLKKQEELSKLESMEKTSEKPSTSGAYVKAPEPTPLPTSSPKSPAKLTPYFLDVAGTKEKSRIRSVSPHEEIEEPKTKRLKTESEEEDIATMPLPGMRRASLEKPKEENPYTVPGLRRISQEKSEISSLLEVGAKTPLLIDVDTQTEKIANAEAESQVTVEMQDQTTQYRYRKKTKNFLSQYRVPNKSVATYFRIKTKEATTQYSPPSDYQDTPADSTSAHPDGGRTDVFGGRERSALKDYISALKDDFLPPGYSKHSGLVLRSLYSQRRQGLLCDITLGAEGRVFKAHKSVLAASSDFFYTLFASEEIEKTPLSHIELQGITAKALNLVLDYTYTSVLPIGSLSSINEIITAAKRLQIHSLISTCPALEKAMAMKIDLAGWLISNSTLLSPSNKHPYVEAINSLRSLSSSGSFHGSDTKNQDFTMGAGDGGAGDFICHVDRDVSSRKKDTHRLPNSYEHYSNDDGLTMRPVSSHIGKHKKKNQSKIKREFEEDKSETESDLDIDKSFEEEAYSKNAGKYDTGVVASPGMPPSSWSETNSPAKSKKKKRKSIEADLYKCMNCTRFFQSKDNYESHCEGHLKKGEKPYGCKLCKKMFWKHVALVTHVYKSHSELSSSKRKKVLSAKVSSSGKFHGASGKKKDGPPHMSKGKEASRPKSKDSGPRPCLSCTAVLQNEVLFARHMRLHHPDVGLSTEEYQYQCDYCLQYFKTGAARAVHIKTHIKAGHVLNKDKRRRIKHADIEDERAAHSEEESSEEDELMYSSDEDHSNENRSKHQDALDSQDADPALKLKLYQCEVCGEMFSIQCFYKAHMAGHKKNLDEY